MMKKKRINMIVAAILSLLFIIGCGGGGGGDSKKVIAEAKLSVSPITTSIAPYDFGGFPLNYNSDQVFTITNSGNFPGVITFSSTGPFSVVNIDCPEKLTGDGANCRFIARFKPTAEVTYQGNISFAGGAAPVYLTGKGYGLNVWINKADFTGCQDMNNIEVTVTNVVNKDVLIDLTEGSYITLTQNGVQVMQNNFASMVIQAPDYVSAVLALDLSGSLTNVLENVKTAGGYFINKFRYDALDKYDEAAICKFKKDVQFYPPSTPFMIPTDPSGKTDLIDNGINGAFSSEDKTALYRALLQSIERASHGTNPKRAVIVLSDGANNIITDPLTENLDNVIQTAVKAGIPIFTIFYVDPNPSSESAKNARPDDMQLLARRTGGQYFSSGTNSVAELDSIFTQIFNIISSKYLITYQVPSAACSGSTNLMVKVDYNGMHGESSVTVP